MATGLLNIRFMVEYYPSLLPKKNAVTLVAHGLNLQPEAMLPLIHWLAGHGSDVFLIKLSGHYKNGVDIKQVASFIWQQEMLEGYDLAYKASKERQVPLFFLGYSLGALLGQSMLALSMADAPFDKQVLIAPAIAIRKRSYLLKLLFFCGKQRKLPSFTPEGWRVNKALPLSVYAILFTEEKKLLDNKFQKLNMLTLVIIDPKDELISCRRLIKRIDRFGLANYRVVVLDPESKGRSGGYHHLVIDEATMGKANWEMVASEMKRFLFKCEGGM